MTLAGAAFDFICLWDAETGELIKRLEFPDLRVESFEALAFGPDGKTLVSAGEAGTPRRGRVVMWDIASGQPRWAVNGHKQVVKTVAFSAKGDEVATGGYDKTIKLWDAQTGTSLKTLAGHKDGVNSIVFNPRGDLLASAGFDHVVRLWDVASGRERRALRVERSSHTSFPMSVAFSADGRSLAVGCWLPDGYIELWDVASGTMSGRLDGKSNQIYSVTFSPSGEQLAITYGGLRSALWDLTGGGGPSLLRDSYESARASSFSLYDFELGGRFSAYHPDGTLLADADRHLFNVKVWDTLKGLPVLSLSGHKGFITATAYSLDGKTLASASQDKTVRLWDANGKHLRTLVGHARGVNHVAFSPDGKVLATASDDATIKLWDVERGKVLRTLGQQASGVSAYQTSGVRALAFHPGGKLLASVASDKRLLRWNTEKDEPPHGLQYDDDIGQLLGGGISASGMRSIAFSPDGRFLTAGTGGPTVTLWNVETGAAVQQLTGHVGGVISVSFAPSGRMLATAGLDRTIKLWDVVSGEEICSLIALGRAGDWAVVKPDGRFDTNNLDSAESLHWVLPGAPFAPMPVEIFMRDYYEPRLLARLVAGEKLRDVRNLSNLNRTQPAVRITSVTPSREDFVTVAVEVSNVKSDVQHSEGGAPLESGVYDVRLFRNGQLVGYGPTPDSAVQLTNGTAKLSFDVRLPRNLPYTDGKQRVEFSAYAFNADRVKSDTARRTHEVIGPSPESEGTRAYLISIGVNTNETPRWRLLYAAADARAIQEVVGKRLRMRQGARDWFSKIVNVPLISDGELKDATRLNLKTVLDALAGRPVDAATLASIPSSAPLRRATPDDLVIITFASHGFTDEHGTFNLIPYDTGGTSGCCVSSDDLSLWLRDVDAGELVMIIDACHSAGVVGGQEFKPAPMGSRGLGQLAYDKGMRILAATQAANVVVESGAIGHGLLTYALVLDGIGKDAADFKAKDGRIFLKEWLEFSVERVPALYELIAAGKLKVQGREVNVDQDGPDAKRIAAKKRASQQPALFDFSRSRGDLLLTETGP